MTEIQTETEPFLTAQKSSDLKGKITAPGDKSISHRALIFGALATGRTNVTGLLESADVLATAQAMRQLGASIEKQGEKWLAQGVGVGGFQTTSNILDFGNSGTAARLIMGAMATSPVTALLSGDASLCKRPMGRVLDPLRQMGARTLSNSGDEAEEDKLPLTFIGTDRAIPITYRLPVPSAQVKSAILLAGLNTPGETTVIEPELTRDHTERMLGQFGAKLEINSDDNGERAITVTGEAELQGCDLVVPGDPSSAAFPTVAALITEGSEVVIENILTNPLRFGLYDTLKEMGANIELINPRIEAGEPVADIKVSSSSLKAIEVPSDRAPSMIDEYPILAIAAACAEGRTVMHGLAELRVKESDRLEAMARGLLACGVSVEEGEDWLAVTGSPTIPGGATIATDMDHRIAMSFLTLGLIADQAITVDGADMIATSFPGFDDLMRGLGAHINGGAG